MKTESVKKYKILLVDDDKFLIDMYSLKFQENGFTVETVFGGEEAVNKLKEKKDFDVVLLDLIMPGMDGFELLENIRSQKLAENSAVIVLSNQGQKEDVDRANQFGVDGYIIKASTIPSEVLHAVVKIADKKFGK
ncbi:TPA: response regulator [Candidatus Campbellbacteria bacterium]|nr:MAG: two component transcriptional regulator, two-component system, OmpR family, response regulator [Candidatus Campbellbacteria bacterium GW2011_OD1_34_28]KKP75411.1 MAG: Transcriptional regulatory protein CpxR [Candidatus Campbellbacteria bacterium GW2011_GWD2_35_24]KKP76028.1 MAG: two component transcriptional regulator, two-component system, OmpR family, response regulator [Candidatus Campbellbacteria bacterium GW2011_GWC2_35_28]KKP77217.1 MAG: Transcriptional regulatory protein CpxR [Can